MPPSVCCVPPTPPSKTTPGSSSITCAIATCSGCGPSFSATSLSLTMHFKRSYTSLQSIFGRRSCCVISNDSCVANQQQRRQVDYQQRGSCPQGRVARYDRYVRGRCSQPSRRTEAF